MREDLVAILFRIEVGKQRGRKDRESGFADADGGVANEQRVVMWTKAVSRVAALQMSAPATIRGLRGKSVAQPAGGGRNAACR